MARSVKTQRKIINTAAAWGIGLLIFFPILWTILTSFTTVLALLALFIFGGEVIRSFTFAMIFGVIVGTYSSIFVASAILLYFGVKRDWSKPDATTGNQFANIDS